MKHRKLLAIFSAALLLLFAGCDYVDLRSGATVFLTVETTVAEYSVDSSYGEVTGESGNFTVSVADKRDFLISVSAEGYATATVPVTVADLKSGSCEKTVYFGDTTYKELTVEFSGVTSGCKLIAGEKEFTGTGTKIIAQLTREELARGVTATAEGAEPRTLTFRESQLWSPYLSASVRLVEEGHKLVSVTNADTRMFALDSENNLLPLDVESGYGYDEYGDYSYSSVGYLTLPLSYTGTIRMRSVDNTATLYISVLSSSDPYDSRNKYNFNLNSSYNDGTVNEILITDFAETDFDPDSRYNFYLETETAIVIAHNFYGDCWDSNGMHLGKKYYLSSWIPEGETPTKVYFAGYTYEYVDGNYTPTEYWSVADYREGIRFSDFTECEPFSAEYGVIEDRTFGGLYTDGAYWKNWTGDSQTQVMFDGDGKFPLQSNAQLYAHFGENWIYISSGGGTALYKKAGGVWCRPYFLDGYVTYRLTVKDEDGNPILGAEVKNNGKLTFEEVGDGVYLIEHTSLGSGRFEVVTADGKILFGEASVNPADNGFWTRAASGREVRGELVVMRKAVLVIAFGLSWSAGASSIGSVGVSDVSSGCKLTKILSAYGTFYYLLEAEAEDICFTVSYRRYSTDMNWGYGDPTYVSESRRIAVTLNELLRGREEFDGLAVRDAYTTIYVDKFGLA